MIEDGDDEALSLHDREVSSRFVRRVVIIRPFGARPFVATEWCDAIVEVAAGVVEVEGVCGARRRFVTGDLLWFQRVALVALRNPGPEPTVLVAIARSTDELPPRAPLDST